MVCQRIATYKMLTPQRRSKLLVEIQAWRAARIAASLPPNSPKQDEQEASEQEEEEEAEQRAPDAEMEDMETEDEEGEADPELPSTRFGMGDALTEFEVAQEEAAAEQQAILDSIQSELEVTANRRYLREADAELEEVFADLDSDEEPVLWAAATDQEAGPPDTAGTEVVDISDDE